MTLNEAKTKYKFFHKKRQQFNSPLKISNLLINECKAERVASLKFLGKIFDEHFLGFSYTLLRIKPLKILEFFIRQKIYSAKMGLGACILLLFTLT